MLAAAKQALTSALGKGKDPVAEWRRKVAEARAELERVQTAQADAVAKRREAFEAEGSEASADALAQAERRAELLTGRASQAVKGAEADLAAAERRIEDAHLAELDATAQGLAEHARDIAERAVPLLTELGRLAEKMGQRVDEAHNAAMQAHRIRRRRGEMPSDVQPASFAAKWGVLRARIAERIDREAHNRAVAIAERMPGHLGAPRNILRPRI